LKNYIKINNRKIGQGFSPYVIAEMSANHNGNIDTAFAIIEQAAISGADAVKIQTYKPDTITLESNLPDFRINEGLWKGRTLFELYDWAHTPWDWHKDLFNHAKKFNITMFSSPFDSTAVDLLEDLGAPAYKIASFEAIDLKLIEYVAATGKPMIISTGMANFQEISEAIETAKQNGCNELAILHCVSGYPAPSEDYNLATIPDMIHNFDLVTGISDHTLTNITSIAAVSLGASIIEKHFTLDRNGGGPDDSFSLEPQDLIDLCIGAKTAWDSLGQIHYDRKASEEENLKFRRSLYFITDLKKGDIIKKESIKSVRPGFGLAPKFFDEILGKKVNCDVQFGTPVTLKLLE
jgi:pseudaminic acid synthase